MVGLSLVFGLPILCNLPVNPAVSSLKIAVKSFGVLSVSVGFCTEKHTANHCKMTQYAPRHFGVFSSVFFPLHGGRLRTVKPETPCCAA